MSEDRYTGIEGRIYDRGYHATVLQQHMFVYSLKAFYIAAYKLFYF